MKVVGAFMTAIATVVGVTATPAFAEQFASAHSRGTCITNSGGTATIQGCVLNASNQVISMPYQSSGNLFYGALKIGGQCLEAKGQGQPLVFTACNSSKAQLWKLTGNTGVLNNEQSLCAELPGETKNVGSTVNAWSCKGGAHQTWWSHGSSRAKIHAIPGMKPVAVGTKLQVMNGNIVAGGAGNIVAAGAGNIVAGGAGNIVAGGAGNIVAGGAGN